MSLTLYLDDCAFSHRLRRLLIEAGHDVQIPADVNPPLTGAPDAIHFVHAKENGRVILTFNPRGFLDLHEQDPDHPGILAVYQDNDPTRDMSYPDIVQAISNLERSDVTISENSGPLMLTAGKSSKATQEIKPGIEHDTPRFLLSQ